MSTYCTFEPKGVRHIERTSFSVRVSTFGAGPLIKIIKFRKYGDFCIYGGNWNASCLESGAFVLLCIIIVVSLYGYSIILRASTVRDGMSGYMSRRSLYNSVDVECIFESM